MMQKKHVAVLFGGQSSEYEISLQSAYAVLQAIQREQWDVLPIGITQQGAWFAYEGPWEAIPQDAWHGGPLSPIAPLLDGQRRGFWKLSPQPEFLPVDVAFPVLHGRRGEDGTVQGLLELMGIPCVGSGVLASALCMDKHRAHQLASLAGVAIPKGVAFSAGELDCAFKRIHRELEPPLFVKPLRAGSSLGISRISAWPELPKAIRDALLLDSQVLVEEEIPGFEVGCAVLGEKSFTVGRVDEIETPHPLFDFHEKYTLEHSAIHTPARISPEKEREIQQAAVTVYRALGCAGYARVDMFLTPTGKIVFNEANTIPGLTGHSRFPAMLQAVGINFPQVVDRLLKEALSHGES